MIFTYNWLQSLIIGKLPKAEKLAELLTMHSFEAGAKRTGKDWILNIDVLPNRMPDCASHLGIVRECAAILNFKLKIPTHAALAGKQKSKAKDFVAVAVEDENACMRYTAMVATSITVGPSPKWMQEKLQACGLRSINNVVDVANYVMLELGQPLHVFDFDKIESTGTSRPDKQKPEAKSVIVRKARRGEKITTLDGESYDLDENILVIADKKEPLAIAGIKGGKKAEIDGNTKTVVLESANFDAQLIRSGSQKLNLKTDASLRFEHGIDPNLSGVAVNRAAKLILELAKGKIIQGPVDYYPNKILAETILLDTEYTARLLGVKISIREIKNILGRLGFQCGGVNTRYIKVKVPTFRLDIALAEDLIEEVARILGYEKIPSFLPSAVLLSVKRTEDIFWEDAARNILKESGLTEVINYSFIGEEDARVSGFNVNTLTEVENPASLAQKYLRPNLIPLLLRNAQKNQYQFSSLQIFEIGRVFNKPKGPEEKRMLAGLLTSKSFYEAKGIVDSLLNGMGISDVWYDEYKPTPEQSPSLVWDYSKCAEIKLGREEIGFVGEIAPQIKEKLSLSAPVAIFDIDFEKLQKSATEEYIYQPVSKYPAAVRDIAVLVPPQTKVVDLLNVINSAGGKLVCDVDLFDIYEGGELPDNKKNMAFHIVYQAEDHTLTPSEIDKAHKKIIAVLEENVEWEVRDN